MSVAGDSQRAWLATELRVENRTDFDAWVTDVSIFCAGNEEGGSSRFSQSDFWDGTHGLLDGYADLPPDSFEEDVVDLFLPDDGGIPNEAPLCENPAYVVVEAGAADRFWLHQRAVVSVDDELVTELNARR